MLFFFYFYITDFIGFFSISFFDFIEKGEFIDIKNNLNENF